MIQKINIIFKRKYLLLLIILFFLFTRLYKISEIPSSVYWDEASIGYNAYSILKTGHDEWGQFLPITFKAFGEYKLPVYIYSVVPFVYFLNLNELSVRLPAILYSLGVVIVGFFLAKKLSGNYSIGLLTAFLITISQWFFIISRTGFEATAGLFFYVLALYLFLRGKEGSGKMIIFSSLSFALSLYCYNSFRIITPISIIILITLYYKEIAKNLQKNLFTIILSLVILTIAEGGVINSLTSGQASRLEDVGISVLYNEKKYQVVKTIISNYLSHFNLDFLFFSGDINKRTQQPGFGEINLIFIPFLFLGILFVLQQRRKNYLLPLILLLISPIPASITKESPHALRSISAVPFLSMISAMGMFKCAVYFKKSLIFNSIILFVLTLSFFVYYRNFLIIYPKQTANDWQYAYKEVFTETSKFSEFDHVIISDKYSQPYIITLFYLHYDPDKFRNEVKYNQTLKKETSVVREFDKFLFTDIDFYQFPKGKSLIFAHPLERMDEIPYKYILNNPDGSLAWYVYEYEK